MPVKLSDFNQQLSKIIHLADCYNIDRNDVLELLLAIKYDRQFHLIPEKTHLKLVHLFCSSSGKIQELIHVLRSPSCQEALNKICLESSLFSISAASFTSIIHALAQDGYAQLPFTLSSETCDMVNQVCHMSPHSCLVSSDKRLVRTNIQNLDELPHGALSAHTQEANIINSDLISSIILDPVLVSIASIYLRSSVTLRHVSKWNSYPPPDQQPQSELAQLFHFDLDEFRWLKLFVFLSDVGPANGPHIYIPRTHKPGSKHPYLLSKGYARVTDSEMRLYHPEDTWITILCRKGTLIFADTRCWHKGTVVTDGYRSILQPEYAPTTFSRGFLDL
jgi:hypothetical protein